MSGATALLLEGLLEHETFRMEERTFLISHVKLKLQNLKLLPCHCCRTQSYLCVCDFPVTISSTQDCTTLNTFTKKNRHKEKELDFRLPPRFALIFNITQLIVVIPHRSFGKNYRSYLQKLRIQKKIFLDS